jgi:hypothetical protein
VLNAGLGATVAIGAETPAQSRTDTSGNRSINAPEEQGDRPHRCATALIWQNELGDQNKRRNYGTRREPRKKRMPETPSNDESYNGRECDCYEGQWRPNETR